MCGLLTMRFRGESWTKASVDEKNKTMLWEACLGHNRPKERREISARRDG